MKIFLFYISMISIGFADISDEPTKPIPDSKAPYRTNFAMPERPPTDQDTLWAQYPNPSVALGLACQHDPAYPFDAWVVDDVVPSYDDYQVEEVVSWWANWQVFISWAYVDEVYFQVYEDSGLGYPFPKIMPSQEVTVLPANFTATTIGTDQYLLEMTLPSTVTLPAGEISWICVQPSNEFTLNGQTGWMGEVGIGNGQELYFAFPLVGTDKWATATQQWGFAYEAGFALLGTEGGRTILFVDDDDGDALETLWVTSFANNGYTYDKWTVADSGNVTPTAVQMGMYDIVVWTTGEDFSFTLVGNDTTEIGNYLSSGGAMWLASQDVLWDIGAVSWMHLTAFSSDVGCDVANGIGPIMSGVSYATTGGAMYDYSDQITGDGMTWDEMQNQTPVINTIAMDSGSGTAYKLFFNTFGYENINDVADRDDMMYRVIEWLVPSGGDVHNVGSVMFLSPETQIFPGNKDVTGVVRNYGDFEETYDVNCLVTDPLFDTLLDATITVTTPIGENDTILFGEVLFYGGWTYDLIMTTLLSGDEHPDNDTLEQTTYVVYSGCNWESWENIDQGRSGVYAGSWDYYYGANVYCFGGNPGPSATALKYEFWDDWTYLPDLPTASAYGGNASVNGKIYMIGAWTGASDVITIFDCPSETYSTVTLPGPITDPAIAVYEDNYIYSIGGSRPAGWVPSTIVMLYDISTDSFWTQVTQLPTENQITAATAGYINNDSLIVSGGRDDGPTNKTTMGAIDPVNPANVTWTSGIPHPGDPAYRCYGDVITDGEHLYGFVVVGGTPNTYQAHMYLSNDGWFTLPDKITACANSGAVAGNWSWYYSWLFTVGGYTYTYLDIFEVFFLQWHMGIQEQPGENVTTFNFSPGSPNPVTEKMRFTLSLPIQGSVHFQVFDATGRQVLDSHYSSISQGEHTLFWNLRDDRGREVPAGSYFYRLQAGDHSATGKIVVVK